MARHVFVLLLVAVSLLQVVLSLPRERRDAATSESPTNILEGIEKLASDFSKKTQEFFSADSLRALQANATELANKVGAAFSGLVEGAASTAAPAAA